MRMKSIISTEVYPACALLRMDVPCHVAPGRLTAAMSGTNADTGCVEIVTLCLNASKTGILV